MKRYGLLPVLALAILVGCTDGNERSLMGPEANRAALASESGGGDALEGATVWTDKDDYQPGDTVTISGAGWWPGETVHLHITEDPQNHPDHEWEVAAGEDGTFVHRELVMDDDHLGVTFTLTATGQSSGSVATTTFTDANSAIVSFSITPSPVNAGADLTWSADAECTGPPSGPNSCSNHGTSVDGPVPNGYIIRLLQAPGACGTVGQVFVVISSATTIDGTAGGTVAAPSDAGLYAYRTDHPTQTINGNLWGAVGQGSTPCVTVEVQQVTVARETETEVTCDPDTVVVNEKTTCKATVTDVDGGSPVTPEGTVTFASSKAGTFDPASATCTLDEDATGVAECTVDFTPSIFNGHDITASYSPTSDHEASDNTAAPFELTVNKRETGTVLACTPGSALADGSDSITCTATVTDVEQAGGKLVPEGFVQFASDPGVAVPVPGDEKCELGNPDLVNFSSSCSVTYTSEATTLEEIIAGYLGDDVHDGSVSDPFYIAFFDPAAGFVTGGGWIWSPKGAYAANPYLEGRANLGFVAQYQLRGRNADPELAGNTQFVFQAADFSFHSSSYEWLVVTGEERARFKGEGTVNGANGYEFMVSVLEGGTGVGRFRIKVWDATTLAVVYDNQEGAADNADLLDEDATILQGGSIVVHTAGNKNNKK